MFDNIANDPMYEKLKETILMCLMNGQKIDVSGSNIQNIKVDVNTFIKGADKLKERFGIDLFGRNVIEMYNKAYVLEDRNEE